MRFKIDWANLIVGNLPFLFYFVFEGNLQVQAPQGAYFRRGDVTEGLMCYEFGGLIQLFRERLSEKKCTRQADNPER